MHCTVIIVLYNSCTVSAVKRICIGSRRAHMHHVPASMCQPNACGRHAEQQFGLTMMLKHVCA